MVADALSWGVPGWVGGGSYFTGDNIVYQTNFLIGARTIYNVTIDYLVRLREASYGEG